MLFTKHIWTPQELQTGFKNVASKDVKAYLNLCEPCQQKKEHIGKTQQPLSFYRRREVYRYFNGLPVVLFNQKYAQERELNETKSHINLRVRKKSTGTVIFAAQPALTGINYWQDCWMVKSIDSSSLEVENPLLNEFHIC
jgi:hypothetical protein